MPPGAGDSWDLCWLSPRSRRSVSERPYLHRLRLSMLVLTGDEDPIIGVVNGRILASLILGAQLHVLRGAGHLFLIDQAKDSAELIRTFLNHH